MKTPAIVMKGAYRLVAPMCGMVLFREGQFEVAYEGMLDVTYSFKAREH